MSVVPLGLGETGFSHYPEVMNLFIYLKEKKKRSWCVLLPRLKIISESQGEN